MTTNCCVKFCKAFWTPKTHLSFFRFPVRNEDLKEKWLKVGPGYKTISKHSRICSDHFLLEDYKILGGKRILKKNVIPSVFKTVQINATKNVPKVDLGREQDCDSATETKIVSQILDLSKKKHICDVETEVSLLHSEANDVEMPRKKFCSVFVQTESRLCGPCPEVLELRHENKILKDRLRRKEKRIAFIKDLVQQLKNGDIKIDVAQDPVTTEQ